MGKHSSKKLQTVFDTIPIEHFQFTILESINTSNLRKETGLKGKEFDNYLSRLLRRKEKEWMKKYSINFSLNSMNKGFG